ncbi:MAG: bifunctional diaminohydroxyphosphoribosylaminopyrimidine deaminase/5-amino-6-(5-phosphoribosylamino)uracil reductase RibD, partial [Gammaproteobacteria bacterium]|nr:bifunctional diaminohydroxyphosphoribosylaminopyrimidine deaminase/5-amino-6-(5-phosphoribosylamino)uracil reductase RibD [Gammaproteobacteria bacterium]
MITGADQAHLAEAVELARRGLYTTTPNPRVGCVIARGDQVLGRGWHQWAGQGHAEIRALEDAGQDVAGATAYVSLEPCSIHGRTPPCADALAAAGIKRVVVGALDPDPRVNGNGLKQLKAAGIEV